MDAAQARQLKIKTGALVRTMKDYTSYNAEKNAQQAKLDQVRAAQAALPAEEQDQGVINRAEAEMAETAAVIPTIAVKIEGFLSDLEGVMGTIEESCSATMEEIKETEEWKKSEAACAEAHTFCSE